MKRRAFIKGAATAGVAAAATAASNFPKPAIAQGIRELKMVTTWPAKLPILGTGAERLAERIKTMSEGKLQVKVFAAGELVPAFQSFDAVSGGTADISHSAAYYWQGKAVGFNFFTTVPFGLSAWEHAAWVHQGGGQELWDELAGQFNLKAFLRGSTGVQFGGWFRKEINTLEDLKGLKFRMPGLGGEVMRRLGVSVVNLPAGEVYAALQSGAIDGTEWVGPFSDMTLGFYKVAKHYYWPGFHEPGTSGELLINKGVWESLTKDQQAMMTALVDSEATLEFAEFNARNGPALQSLVGKHNVELRQFSNDVLMQVGKVSGEVVAEIGNSDPLTKKIYDSYTKFRTEILGYTKVAEQAFLNARALPFKYG